MSVARVGGLGSAYSAPDLVNPPVGRVPASHYVCRCGEPLNGATDLALHAKACPLEPEELKAIVATLEDTRTRLVAIKAPARDARIVEALKGVDAAWLPFIDEALLAKTFDGIDAFDQIMPALGDVFNFLRDCPPSRVRVCIVGQDPYYNPGEATGRAFAVPRGVKVPPSLRNVYACLLKSGRIRAAPAHGDLRPWAAQGVLLLNAALTTRVGTPKAHVKIWALFAAGFVRSLCERLDGLRFLLWGTEARDLVAPAAAKFGRECLLWTHPSPTGDNRQPPEKRFANCDHFARLDAALTPPIRWAIDTPCFAFTDGSCTGNGMSNAKAGFGVLIAGGHLGGATVRGSVAPLAYGLVDAERPEAGFRESGGAKVAPSNNRGELLSICWALLTLLRGRALGRIEIFSDSLISVNTFNTWLADWRRKGIVREKKNVDLIEIAEALLVALRAQADEVVITHTYAAHDHVCPADARGKIIHGGNARVDALAKSAVAEGVALEVKP